MPAERIAGQPWLLIPDARGAVLNTPWPARRGALTEAEAATADAMRDLAADRPLDAPCWISPDGTVTPVAAGPGWLAARLRDYLTVRV
jgi:hypothetical protein